VGGGGGPEAGDGACAGAGESVADDIDDGGGPRYE